MRGKGNCFSFVPAACLIAVESRWYCPYTFAYSGQVWEFKSSALWSTLHEVRPAGPCLADGTTDLLAADQRSSLLFENSEHTCGKRCSLLSKQWNCAKTWSSEILNANEKKRWCTYRNLIKWSSVRKKANKNCPRFIKRFKNNLNKIHRPTINAEISRTF